MPIRHIIIATLVGLAVRATPTVAQERTPAERVAIQLSRSATLIIDADFSVDALEIAVILVEQATKLDPDNPDLWRLAIELAEAAEAEELRGRAIGELLRLDPADESARLQRLSLALDQYNEVEPRIEACRRLLDPGQVERMDRAVASRLALELALMERRRGNLEAFGEQLAEAVALDPANRAASAIAAGFFRANVDDPVAEAELLTDLMLADPTDIMTQVAVAELMLEHGAYPAAARLYDLATRNQAVAERAPASELLADKAIAEWASGDLAAALRTIRFRQRQVNERHRIERWREDPTLDPVDRAKLRAPIHPTLATVRAAVQATAAPEVARRSLEMAREAYRSEIDRLADPPEEVPEEQRIRAAQRRLELQLELAWALLWLAGPEGEARSIVDAVDEIEPLSDAARQRFDGWIALRQGDVDHAIELLEPIAATDPAASVGLAQAYLGQERRADAARALLRAARDQPGSLIGIGAANQLAEIVGQRVLLTEVAGRLQELIDSIPGVFFRFPEDPTLAVELRVEPIHETFDAYEPIVVNIEVINHSPFHLAIDRDGPIRPGIVLLFATTFNRAGAKQELPAVVLDIGRRLSLAPRERVVIPVELRRYGLGEALSLNALQGIFLQLRVVLNPRAKDRAVIEPGLFGSEVTTSMIRIEGIRVTTAWVRNALEIVRDPVHPKRLQNAVALNQFAGVPLAPEASDEQRQLFEEAKTLLTETFATLDPVAQTWWIAEIPSEKMLEPIGAMARRSEEPLVQLAFLLFQIEGEDDPMIDAARRSEHEPLRRIAESYARVIGRGDDVDGAGAGP